MARQAAEGMQGACGSTGIPAPCWKLPVLKPGEREGSWARQSSVCRHDLAGSGFSRAVRT